MNRRTNGGAGWSMGALSTGHSDTPRLLRDNQSDTIRRRWGLPLREAVDVANFEMRGRLRLCRLGMFSTKFVSLGRTTPQLPDSIWTRR